MQQCNRCGQENPTTHAVCEYCYDEIMIEQREEEEKQEEQEGE